MVCVTAPIVMHLFMLCTIFDRKTACNLFQILFAPLPRPPQKNPLRLRFLKTRIWIWFEESAKRVDFMDSWSVFGFAQKGEKSSFGFGNPDFDFPPKKCTLSIEDSEKEVLLLTVSFMFDFLVYLTVTLQWVLLPRLHLKTV